MRFPKTFRRLWNNPSLVTQLSSTNVSSHTNTSIASWTTTWLSISNCSHRFANINMMCDFPFPADSLSAFYFRWCHQHAMELDCLHLTHSISLFGNQGIGEDIMVVWPVLRRGCCIHKATQIYCLFQKLEHPC